MRRVLTLGLVAGLMALAGQLQAQTTLRYKFK